jgi:hypothetical protein
MQFYRWSTFYKICVHTYYIFPEITRDFYSTYATFVIKKQRFY